MVSSSRKKTFEEKLRRFRAYRKQSSWLNDFDPEVTTVRPEASVVVADAGTGMQPSLSNVNVEESG